MLKGLTCFFSAFAHLRRQNKCSRGGAALFFFVLVRFATFSRVVFFSVFTFVLFSHLLRFCRWFDCFSFAFLFVDWFCLFCSFRSFVFILVALLTCFFVCRFD